MPYIAILQDRSHSDAEVEAYRYGDVEDAEMDTPAWLPGARIRVWWTESAQSAQNQADRLSSGLIGARVCESDNDLAETMGEWQA